MFQRQPSLNALRIFLAVARSGGVTRAAEALHLTHSAVSHQIRALQEELGIDLFEKKGRGLTLSAAGRAFAERLESVFDGIDEAVRELRTQRRSRLRISAIPSFAALWLLPRLGDFVTANPDFDVEMESSARLVDFKSGESDVAIRFGSGRYPGLACELLMRDWLFPVCSPDFVKEHRLEEASWVDGLPLLHSDNEPWSWWFTAAGIVADEPEHGVVFNDSAFIVQAAVAGQGLGLVRQSLAADALRAGRLVRPFPAAAESPHAYYFVCRKEKRADAAVARFRQWIFRQVEAFPAPA